MARRRGERDRGKELFWREMVGRWRRSGLTIREFCAKHDLSEPSFYAWRREFEPTGAPSARRHAKVLPAFVPVQLIAAEPAPALEVVVAAGHVVRVAPGFDAATLRSLLAVLAEPPAC